MGETASAQQHMQQTASKHAGHQHKHCTECSTDMTLRHTDARAAAQPSMVKHSKACSHAAAAAALPGSGHQCGVDTLPGAVWAHVQRCREAQPAADHGRCSRHVLQASALLGQDVPQCTTRDSTGSTLSDSRSCGVGSFGEGASFDPICTRNATTSHGLIGTPRRRPKACAYCGAKTGQQLTSASVLPEGEGGSIPQLSADQSGGVSVCVNGKEAPVRLQVCLGCRYVRYCSKDCQRAHWQAGHRKACVQLRQRAQTSKQEQHA